MDNGKKLVPPPLPKYPPRILHPRFPIISANVKRIISHSNPSLHLNDMTDNQSIDKNGGFMDRKRSKPHTTTATQQNGSKFKHPLSKNTCKITQSTGNDLVIDDSDGGYATPPEIIPKSMMATNFHSNNIIDLNDIDKTPTNECPLIKFDHVLDQFNGNDAIDHDIVEENNLLNQENAIQKSFLHSFTSKMESASTESGGDDSSIQNSPTLSQKSTDSDKKIVKSQLFTIAAAASQVNEQSSKHSSLSRNSSNETIANINNNNNVDDDDDDDNYATISESAPEKMSTGQKTEQQTKIDLKRTKIRPLSSVSISSTSSSSSSASDEHSTTQNAISYLASVESLADHSENELNTLGTTLTVTERSCLEIVDSERNYVDDLGQVIKG